MAHPDKATCDFCFKPFTRDVAVLKPACKHRLHGKCDATNATQCVACKALDDYQTYLTHIMYAVTGSVLTMIVLVSVGWWLCQVSDDSAYYKFTAEGVRATVRKLEAGLVKLEAIAMTTVSFSNRMRVCKSLESIQSVLNAQLLLLAVKPVVATTTPT
jgi:hypothetical protein